MRIVREPFGSIAPTPQAPSSVIGRSLRRFGLGRLVGAGALCQSAGWLAAVAISLPLAAGAETPQGVEAAIRGLDTEDKPAIEVAGTESQPAVGPVEDRATARAKEPPVANVFGPPVGTPPGSAVALPGADSRPRAPDFSLRTLSGQRLKLSDFKGKVVILSFWATWCAPCKQELPVLQGLLDRYGKDGLTVLAINTDDPKTVAEVRRFVADRKLTMPVPLDGDSKVLGRFNPRHALPFLQILDHEGRRTFQHTGFTSGAEKILEDQIVALIGEKPATVATP